MREYSEIAWKAKGLLGSPQFFELRAVVCSALVHGIVGTPHARDAGTPDTLLSRVAYVIPAERGRELTALIDSNIV